MKKMIFAVIIAFLLVGVFVAAEDNSTNLAKEGNFSANCNSLNARIDARITQYQDGKVEKLNEYKNTLQKAEDLAAKMEKNGVSVDTISPIIQKINESIVKFDSDYGVFIQDLMNTKNFTCGHSQGEFVGALGIAKAQLRVLKMDSDAIKGDMRQLRQMLQSINIEKRINKIENRTAARNDAIDNRINSLENRSGRTMGNIENRTAGLERVREMMNEKAANRTAMLQGRLNASGGSVN